VETYSLILVIVILFLIVRERRVGNAAIRNDPNVTLKPSERFRTLKMQALEPLVAVVVVGSLLINDLGREPRHGVAALVGAAAGFAFGTYRARSTFVAAIPHHRGVVLKYSVESIVALVLLLAIKVIAEEDLLPDGDVFEVAVAGLLAFLLIESAARVLTLWRMYKHGAKASATAS
jgi:hypothetical protein